MKILLTFALLALLAAPVIGDIEDLLDPQSDDSGASDSDAPCLVVLQDGSGFELFDIRRISHTRFGLENDPQYTNTLRRIYVYLQGEKSYLGYWMGETADEILEAIVKCHGVRIPIIYED